MMKLQYHTPCEDVIALIISLETAFFTQTTKWLLK